MTRHGLIGAPIASYDFLRVSLSFSFPSPVGNSRMSYPAGRNKWRISNDECRTLKGMISWMRSCEDTHSLSMKAGTAYAGSYQCFITGSASADRSGRESRRPSGAEMPEEAEGWQMDQTNNQEKGGGSKRRRRHDQHTPYEDRQSPNADDRAEGL